VSIIHAFDPDTAEILSPSVILPVENFPEVVLSCWSHKFIALLKEMGECRQISAMTAGGRSIPVCETEYKGLRFAFYASLLGGAATAALLEEAIAMGGRKFLFFGSCGALDADIAAGGLLIPDKAWRDEGTSYHYAPASDFLEIHSAPILAKVFEDMHVPFCRIKTWTTDAIYRETQRNAALRREAGCAAVEMECASLMAAAQFRGVTACQFLYAADCLSETTWDSRILGSMPDTLRQRILQVALEALLRLQKC